MAFRVGERVRFLHEKQEGVVTKILGKGMIEVLIDDFVEEVVAENEVVRIDATEKVLAPRTPEKEEEKAPLHDIGAQEIVLSETRQGTIQIFILNPKKEDLLIAVYLRVRHKYKSLAAGSVPAGERLMIAEIPSADRAHARQLYLQVIPVPKAENAKPVQPFHREISFVTDYKMQRVEPVDGLNISGRYFSLHPPVSEAVLGGEIPESGIKEADQLRPNGREVIDLHIEELVQGHEEMSAGEMLQVQIEKFEQELDKALFRGDDAIIFIHGSGSGRLRSELARIAKDHPSVKFYSPADQTLYGNGATIFYLH